MNGKLIRHAKVVVGRSNMAKRDFYEVLGVDKDRSQRRD